MTIGTFDGLHSGHRKLLFRVINQAKDADSNSIVVTFDLHPKEFLDSATSTLILTTLAEKKKLISDLKPDFLVILPFAEIFNLHPEAFVEDILFRTLKIKKIIVGDDFVFGKHRLGNIDLLKNMGQKLGFEVEVMERTKNSKNFISSTLARSLVVDGYMKTAGEILGHNYIIRGLVCETNTKTTQITLKNLNKIIPPLGLYEVKIDNSETTQNFELIKTEIKDNWQVITFKNQIFGYKIGQEIQIEFVG
jgi:riboflavin kinase/FMN adenylyltransferase